MQIQHSLESLSLQLRHVSCNSIIDRMNLSELETCQSFTRAYGIAPPIVRVSKLVDQNDLCLKRTNLMSNLAEIDTWETSAMYSSRFLGSDATFTPNRVAHYFATANFQLL